MTDQPEFTLTIDQNPYLPVGGEQMHAVLTVTATGPALAATAATEAAEVVIVDHSGSMAGGKLVEAKRAAKAAVDTLRDGVHFAIVAGNHEARQVYPDQGLAVARPATRRAAKTALRRMHDEGGTAIGRWLRAAADLLAQHPEAVRHAILLTDGQNNQSKQEFDQDLGYCAGKFTCDSLGVGEDWNPDELARVAEALLGTRDYVREPADLAAYFTSLTGQAMGKAVAELALRVRVPQQVTVRFLKQVHPTTLDLTGRRADADYPTGSWGAEERDYQLCVDVPAGGADEEIRVAAVSLVRPDTGAELARGNVLAIWTDDIRHSTRVSAKVAHYTGQLELSDQVQEGLRALDAGDAATATARLAGARRLAEDSGNTGTLRLLDKLVDVDPGTGTAKLRRQIATADRIALDVGTDRTAKVRPDRGEP